MTSYKVDYFELPTRGTAISENFFRKAFGWDSKSYGPGYSELVDTGLSGVLGGLSADAGESPSGVLVGIRTDDIAAAEKAIVDAGGTITRPVYDYPGGQRFFFREPGGSEMLVYCPAE